MFCMHGLITVTYIHTGVAYGLQILEAPLEERNTHKIGHVREFHHSWKNKKLSMQLVCDKQPSRMPDQKVLLVSEDAQAGGAILLVCLGNLDLSRIGSPSSEL